jgi:hypothetical protein
MWLRWNVGMMAKQADAWLPTHHYSIIPLFHYSILPFFHSSILPLFHSSKIPGPIDFRETDK